MSFLRAVILSVILTSVSGLLISACSQHTDLSSTIDSDRPYPIFKNPDATNAPDSYKGLQLALTDNGDPELNNTSGKTLTLMVCIGMSNAYQECEKFIRGVNEAWVDQVRPEIKVVNCAKGGHAIEKWNDPAYDDVLWDACADTLNQQGYSLQQVKVVLHKAANQYTLGPEGQQLPFYPDTESDYYNFKDNLGIFADRVTTFFPNLDAVFTSSRSYGGFTDRAARGEPLSYEEGHALNVWLKENSLYSGVWFGWGPYIWAPSCTSGIVNGHGICYDREDYESDGVHPSPSGEIKIATMWHRKLSQYQWYLNN